jgi:hypothetical protein
MKRLILSILKRFIYWYLRAVPLSALKCEQRKVAIEEGWGGQAIDCFPPCGFYKMFNDGSEEKAVVEMEKWYYERLVEKRLCDVAKTDGGMRDGSLYKLIAALHRADGIDLKEDLSNANESFIFEAITMRVEERFELLKSIRLYGYSCVWDYISTRKEENQYILIDGHHRVAALYVCGYHSVMVANSNPITLRIAVKLGRLLVMNDESVKNRSKSINATKYNLNIEN